MDDLISRKAAIDALGEEPLVWNEDDAGEVAERNQWKLDVAAIKALPSAERHGKWLMIDKGHHFYDWECSICGGSGRADHLFCPNCGASMDEEDTNANETL